MAGAKRRRGGDDDDAALKRRRDGDDDAEPAPEQGRTRRDIEADMEQWHTKYGTMPFQTWLKRSKELQGELEKFDNTPDEQTGEKCGNGDPGPNPLLLKNHEDTVIIEQTDDARPGRDPRIYCLSKKFIKKSKLGSEDKQRCDWIQKANATELKPMGMGGACWGGWRYSKLNMQSNDIVTRAVAEKLMEVADSEGKQEPVKIRRSSVPLRIGNIKSRMGVGNVHGQLPGDLVYYLADVEHAPIPPLFLGRSDVEKLDVFGKTWTAARGPARGASVRVRVMTNSEVREMSAAGERLPCSFAPRRPGADRVVVLHPDVVVIGARAFDGFHGAGTLELPPKITEIGEKAFYRCEGFEGPLVIPEGVTKIGESAFASCSGFDKLKLPQRLTELGEEAFVLCTGFKEALNIPNGTIMIDHDAFRGCTGFTKLTLPNSLTRIGMGAFRDCEGFEGALELPSSLTMIEDGAFASCAGFTSLTLPESLIRIRGGAFSKCRGFKCALKLPSKLTKIEEYTFEDCADFTSLTLPDSLTEIGESAFEGCLDFKGALMIPEGVQKIGESAFARCWRFTSLTLPDSLTEIGPLAFQYCHGFKGALNLPSSLTKIGEAAFLDCKGFEGVLEIPHELTEIGRNTFKGCERLTSVEVVGPRNNSLTIEAGAFLVRGDMKDDPMEE